MNPCVLEAVAQASYLYEAEAFTAEHAEDHMEYSIWSGLRARCGEQINIRNWARASLVNSSAHRLSSSGHC